MKRYLVFLLCWALLMPAHTAMADDVCPQPVTPLNIGQPSPCTGYLFSPQKEKQLRLLNDDYSFLQQQVDMLGKQKVFMQGQLNDYQSVVDSQKKEIDIWRVEAVNDSQQLIKAEEGRGTRDALFFGGGVLAALIFSIIANSLRH